MAIIEFEVHDHSALITLNRPEARNAVNQELAEALEDSIDRFEDDDELWTGVITGTAPVFSAGADLKAVSKGGARLGTKRGGFAGFVLRERNKPIIAAVDGAALAGGCEIVLACDLVVASTAAMFGVPEVKRSLVAGAGGLARLPRKLPPNIAMEMILTGDPISAEKAAEFGLVNRLVEPGKAVEVALELAAQINVNAPLAVRASKHLAVETPSMEDRDAIKMASLSLRELASTEDYKEGPLAFIEKRAPNWQGR
jgi:enoyl-CoA hydratase